jgi:hypothetical protein
VVPGSSQPAANAWLPEPGATLFLPDEQLVLSGGSVHGSRYYTLANTAVAVRSATGTVAYLVPDRQGSDVLQIAATTHVAVREAFTPFETARTSAPAWIGDSGYVGGTVDSATGLVNHGSRLARKTLTGTGCCRCAHNDTLICDAGPPLEKHFP